VLLGDQRGGVLAIVPPGGAGGVALGIG